MIRQLVLASCLVAVVFSACKTVGPAMGGSCPPELALVNNDGREECTAAANVAACGGTVTPSNTGCQDAEATLCPSWVEKGYCTSNMYTKEGILCQELWPLLSAGSSVDKYSLPKNKVVLLCHL